MSKQAKRRRKRQEAVQAKYDKAARPVIIQRRSNPPFHGDYLQSERWVTTRNVYMSCYPYCECMVCRNPRFNLHHVTYTRYQNEWFKDLIPICSRHHKVLHDAHKKFGRPLSDFRAILLEAFPFNDEILKDRLKRYEALPNGPILDQDKIDPSLQPPWQGESPF